MKIIKQIPTQKPLEFRELKNGDVFGFIHTDFLQQHESENVFLKTDEGIVSLASSTYFSPKDYECIFICDIIEQDENEFDNFIELLEYQYIFLYNAELRVERKKDQ